MPTPGARVLACAPGDALRWPPAVSVLTLTGRKGIAQRPRCCRWEKADPRTQDRPHPSLLVGQLSGLRLSFPPTPRWGLDHPARSASSPQGGNHAEPGATARLPGCPAAWLIDSQAPAVREFTVEGGTSRAQCPPRINPTIFCRSHWMRTKALLFDSAIKKTTQTKLKTASVGLTGAPGARARRRTESACPGLPFTHRWQGDPVAPPHGGARAKAVSGALPGLPAADERPEEPLAGLVADLVPRAGPGRRPHSSPGRGRAWGVGRVTWPRRTRPAASVGTSREGGCCGETPGQALWWDR